MADRFIDRSRQRGCAMPGKALPQTEWISAKETLAVLSTEGRNPVSVKAMIADYLRDGLLEARAEAVWVSTEPNLGKSWKTDDVTADVERNIVVPVRYWRTDRRAETDRARWRWPYNKFFYTLAASPLKRRMFKGITFSTRDLTNLQPKDFSGRVTRPRGRNLDKGRRDAGWLEIVKLAQGEHFNLDFFETQNDLIEQLKTTLQDAEGNLRLGETQIAEIARMVHPLLKPRG